MRLLYFFFFLFTVFLDAQYLDNHSCKECHEQIYEEYQGSGHAQSYFSNELHRSVADKVSKTKYGCASCHMPAADNIEQLISGEARPNIDNKTHSDGVSCFFCHTIAYVKNSHPFNVNIKARQAEGYKPTLYGRLNNPDESDKHSSVTNPVYAQNVCKGCHSHKRNDYNATVFSAMEEGQNSLDCIRCHMPEAKGGVEKMDKRARGKHVSHMFFGIRDEEFRKEGVDINLSIENGSLLVHLHNKMGHPLIIQPARAKYLRITLMRGGKTVWQNYKNDPKEDMQGYFASSFYAHGEKVILPAKAMENKTNNLDAEEKRTLRYPLPQLRKGDKISVDFFVQLAKNDCTELVDLNKKALNEPQLIKTVLYKQN